MNSHRLLCILLILSALVSVFCDTNVCQSTTALVKSAVRQANAWRAVCEDAGWQGSGCYNYWAQLDEVMRLSSNLQECSVTTQLQYVAYMLGTTGTPSPFAVDAGYSQSEMSSDNAVTNKLIASVEAAARNNVTQQYSAVLSAAVAQVLADASSTQSFVHDSYGSINTKEGFKHADLQSLVSYQGNNEQSVSTSNEATSRSFTDLSHNQLQTEISAAHNTEALSSQSESTSTENVTRTLETTLSRATNGVQHDSTDAIRAQFTSQSNLTRSTISALESSTRSIVVADEASTRNGVNQASNSTSTFVSQQAQAVRGTVNDTANNFQANVSATAKNLRGMINAVQLLMASGLSSESSQMNSMWGLLYNFTVHLDLQGNTYAYGVEIMSSFGATNTFQTPMSRGGHFEDLRAYALETITINQQIYGTNKVGNAVSDFNAGEVYYRNGDYRNAANKYRLAYQDAVVSQ